MRVSLDFILARRAPGAREQCLVIVKIHLDSSHVVQKQREEFYDAVSQLHQIADQSSCEEHMMKFHIKTIQLINTHVQHHFVFVFDFFNFLCHAAQASSIS
jgi:hypothetical protein